VLFVTTLNYSYSAYVYTANLVVHEFAFLCLSSLAVDFTTKITVAQKGGLPILVSSLSSTDPDIQRNCVETLALVLQVPNDSSFCSSIRLYDKF